MEAVTHAKQIATLQRRTVRVHAMEDCGRARRRNRRLGRRIRIQRNVEAGELSIPRRGRRRPDVVARAFGVYQKRNGDLELWYIGARRSHPLSNSEGGTRWGVFGIERAPDSHGKARWNISGGSSITRTKNRDRIQGSPNPYVFACLVRMSQGCTHVSQNPEMPCAQLFHSDYSHLTHPSTHVLFTAAGFIKSKFLDHYTWSGTEEDLIRIRDGVLARMAQGEPVVHSS